MSDKGRGSVGVNQRVKVHVVPIAIGMEEGTLPYALERKPGFGCHSAGCRVENGVGELDSVKAESPKRPSTDSNSGTDSDASPSSLCEHPVGHLGLTLVQMNFAQAEPSDDSRRFWSATAHPASVSAIQLDFQPWIHSAASTSFIERMFHCWMAGSAYASTTMATSFACQGRRISPLSVFSSGCGIAARAPGSTTGSTREGHRT